MAIIRYLHLGLTAACNLNCKHCFIKEKESKELSFEKAIAFIDVLEKQGLTHIYYTYGEPLLYHRLSLIPGMREKILNKQVKVSNADMRRLARVDYFDRKQTLQDILHPELKVEPKPDADGVIRVPGKAPVMPFKKLESVYDSDAYPEDLRYKYVALEDVTTRFRIAFDYQLEQMPDTAQRDVILEIIQKHKDYLASLEAALVDDKEQTA